MDTGAPVSAIDVSRHRHYGLDSISSTSKLPPKLMINGALNTVGIAKSLRIGALNLVDEPDGRDRSRFEELHRPSSGRRGNRRHSRRRYSFPTRAVLDCQRRLLILNLEPQSETITPGVDYRGMSSMPIHVSDGYNLYVDGAINGAPALLMVDTGAFATLLHRSFVKRMKIPLRDTPFRSAAVNLNMRDVQIARIRRLSVGSVDIVGHNVGVVDLGGLIHGGLLVGKRPVAGLLGSELLQRHHGIIDFGTRRLHTQRLASNHWPSLDVQFARAFLHSDILDRVPNFGVAEADLLRQTASIGETRGVETSVVVVLICTFSTPKVRLPKRLGAFPGL